MPIITAKEARKRNFSLDWHIDSDGNFVSQKGFGRYDQVCVVDESGGRLFDQIIFDHCPGVFAWVFAHCPDGGTESVLIKERRDATAPTDGKTSHFYLGPPRGNIDPGEIPLCAAARETVEETGAEEVLGVWDLGRVVTNESVTGSFTHLVAVEIAYGKLGAIKNHDGEYITQAQFYTHQQIMEMMRHEMMNDAFTNSLVFSGAYMRFLSCLEVDYFNQPSQLKI